MHVCPPDNPTEDRLIMLLDRGVSLSERMDELAKLRMQMRQREHRRLAELRQDLNREATKARPECELDPVLQGPLSPLQAQHRKGSQDAS